ncbi:MAG: PPE domain-containing protein [Actinophytocola sp.]|uniref:PPE domain-containing protein n=1 Tax=Actinophytocola sp. TaxID=1872138 RepID=UPI001326A15F|nr:PPE domain-containing protein [Actinophytocola sp.]MPZ79932.1 PPE domain-containing protein [Actinophytocola sp.]
MDGDYGLSNLRFNGYSNEELAQQVDGLRDGAGSETLHNAVAALVSLADGLAETDKTLRKGLEKVGVTWQGEASEGGAGATENASIYADDAQEPVTDSAKGVDTQGASFSTTRNSAPESSVLRGPSQENFGDRVAGVFGYTTDHAEDVRATNEARDQAVDGMNGYQSSSSDALGRSQALPVPPGMNLVAQPVEQNIGTTTISGYSPNGGLNPSAAGTGGGGGGNNVPLATGGGGGGGLPPTAGGPPNVGLPGNTTGVGPVSQPGLPTAPGAGPGGLRPPLNPMVMGEAAAMMGAGGAGGAGAGAQGDRTLRGGGAGGAGKTPVKGATPLGAAPEEETRAARNAERFGAKTGRPGSSIMQPAAGGRRGEGEDDQEHVRRFGIDSGDVFDDDRVVAPESIGDDPDEDRV